MARKKKILIEGIGNKEEKEEIKEGRPVHEKKKRRHLFSWAVFSESLKSKRGSLFLVSGLNALIMVVIRIIMSGLNINATADSRKDRFSNADREKTIKQSTIGFYTSFENSAEMVVTFDNAEAQRKQALSLAMDKVEDKQLTNALDAGKVVYQLTYNLTSGDTEAKKTAAEKASLSAFELALKTTSLSEEEKKVALEIASSFFEAYGEDRNETTKNLLVSVLPAVIAKERAEEAGKGEDEVKSATATITACFDKVFHQSYDQDKAIQEALYPLRQSRADEDETQFLTLISTEREKAYEADKDKFIADSKIHDSTLSSVAENYIIDSYSDRLYYDYLPDFTVNYVTSDFGYPITYVGTGKYSENGQEIRKEEEIKEYNPSLFIKVNGDRGTSATRVEKRHKKAITGSDYSEEEYKAAKEKADESLPTLKDALNKFLTAFFTRDQDNKNRFFDGKNVVESEVALAAQDRVSQRAEQQIIANYNEKNSVKVSSIEEITSQNSSLSGQARRDRVDSYAASSISSYKSYYKSALKKGYGRQESRLIATVKASQGVINELPDKVGDSLTEMGNRNTYGIIVGRIGFARTTLLVPMVYSILLANDLVANKVETGSLAFTLSTPLTRKSYIFTESCFRIFSEIVRAVFLFVFATISRYIGISLGGSDFITSLPRKDVALYALGNFMVTLAISGICFLSSSIFNKSNKAIGIGGGLTIFFFICSILGLFGTKAIPGTIRIDSRNIFNYRTIVSFFDPLAVRDHNYFTFFIKLIGLLVITVVCYLASSIIFKKKDLPL